jgi:NADH-quinone oxidoreductase subunit C
MQEKEKALSKPEEEDNESTKDELIRAKKEAAAKAKAAALARMKQKEAVQTDATEPQGSSEDEKQKAIALAKAKAVAAAKAKLASKGEAGPEDEKTKAIAAAKAKAVAAAKAKASAAEETAEITPSVNQPLLERYVSVLTAHVGADALEDSYINRLSKDVPTLVVKRDAYYEVMEFLRKNEQMAFDYMSELHGTDFVTHMEVYVHLYSYRNRQPVAVKVKVDREKPVLSSVAPLWKGADWPEREAYDLLGIVFEGHPNLKRILLPDDWIGYPLRKDYEPFDGEV